MVLADPKLTQAETDFLESVPDLFKASPDEFDISRLRGAVGIVRCRLSRRPITDRWLQFCIRARRIADLEASSKSPLMIEYQRKTLQ